MAKETTAKFDSAAQAALQPPDEIQALIEAHNLQQKSAQAFRDRPWLAKYFRAVLAQPSIAAQVSHLQGDNLAGKASASIRRKILRVFILISMVMYGF